MSAKPRALDLFCGAGGATRGLQMAGFHVTGVDNRPQPRYVGECFRIADALKYVEHYGREFDFIWASPPCQAFTSLNKRFKLDPRKHPNLIGATREALKIAGISWVIENVWGAPLKNPIVLCGSMFGLQLKGKGYLRRHRLFESNFFILAPPCNHFGKGRALTIAGHGATDGKKGGMKLGANDARLILDTPWMNRDGAAQAIPPAYSEFIGRQAMQYLRMTA